MAKRSPETLDDLLLRNGESLDAFAKRSGVPRYTLFRLREGKVDRPRIATIAAIAAGLRLDVARVRAAIEASRAAAN